MNWVSRKLTRVSKSTLASEAIARVGAVEDVIRIAGWLEEIYSAQVTTKELLVKQESGGFRFPVDVVTDARALHEVLVSPMEPRPSDAACLLWLKHLREVHKMNIVRRALWTSTVDMLGDGLTKNKPESNDLRKLFSSGKVCLKYASLSGSAVIDSWKGRPPTKKEKEEQGYQLVESLFLSAFLSQSGQ